MKRLWTFAAVGALLWGCGVEPRVDDLRAMARPGSPNSYLICAATYCAAAHDEEGPVLDMPAERVLAAVRRVAAQQANIASTREDPALGQVVFVQYTPVLRFPDIVRVQAIPAPGGRVALAFYSQSLYGYYDFGVNKRRARDWMEAINAELKRG